jgi:hypothetical protein
MAQVLAVLKSLYNTSHTHTQILFNLPIAERDGGAGAATRSAALHCGSGGAGASGFCCLHVAACGGFMSGLVPDGGMWSCSRCLATAIPTGMAAWTHHNSEQSNVGSHIS